jgi:uncharacterized protein (DUF4415 family)
MPTKERNTVKRTLDLKNPPVLSAEQKARLDAMASMPDEQIDYSDAPSLPDAVWMKTIHTISAPDSLGTTIEVLTIEAEQRRQARLVAQADVADKDIQQFMAEAAADTFASLDEGYTDKATAELF